MKILFIIPGFNSGGAERQCLYLSQALSEFHNITLAYFYEGNYKYILDECNINKIKIESKSFYSPSNIFKINSIIRKNNFHLVFSWLPIVDVYMSFIKLINKNFIWVVAERDSNYENNFRDNLRKIMVKNFADAIIANSQNGVNFWQSLNYNRNITSIPNIIKPLTKHNHKEKKPIISKYVLFIGRFKKQKNVLYTYDLFKYLAVNNNMKFIMIGDGPFYDFIKKDIYKSKLDYNIKIYRNKANVIDFYNKCELFISLSHHEGMPNTLIEAVLLNKKIIVSNISQHTNLLGTNFPNYIDTKDSITENAKKVLKAYKNKHKQSDYEFIKCKLKNYSPKKISIKYSEHFNFLKNNLYEKN